MFKNAFANLQKVGKSLMLPVSVLPIENGEFYFIEAILNTFPQVFTRKKRCRNWAPGIPSPRNWHRLRTFAAHWRWWSEMKRH
jgi:hypothetical protein